MRKTSKILSLFMSLVLVFTMLSGLDANAATKNKLNKVKVTIKVGQTVTLKVKKNKKKVKWSSKNKKVATVTKKGKVKGRKAGKTYIIAKVGKKKYKCRVIVKKKTSTKPVQTTKPVESTRPIETTKPVETTAAVETTSLEETTPDTSKPESSASDFGYNDSASGVTINKYYGKSATVVIPASIGGKSVVGISDFAFQEGDDSAVRITSVVIPETVTSIGRLAFGNCNFLKTLEIKGNSLKTIGNQVFDQCKVLESVKLPSTVQSIGEYAFYGCTALESITIPTSTTSIAVEAFEECTALKTIKGAKGSYAETFANENGFTFVEK